MMITVREMLTEALEALKAQDVARASRVIDKDEVVDAYYSECRRILAAVRRPATSSRHPRSGHFPVHQRIGDHAANVAERVIFIVTGEDVRHFSRMSRSDFS